MGSERSRLLAACLPFALVGCESIIGADFGAARLAPATDGGCRPVGAPRRPAELPSASDTVDFTVVIHGLDFGDEASDSGVTMPVGYDLDGLCTGMHGPRSCKPFPWLDSVVVDGPGGRDDAVGSLFGAQKSVFGGELIGTTEENAGVAAGTLAPTGVLRVHGFSGLASDDHVVVELFQVAAFGVGRSLDGGAPRAPAFDASDEWPLVRATLAEPDAGGAPRTVQRDESAFVMDRKLVARFDVLNLPVRNVYVEVSEAVLSGSVHYTEDEHWTLVDGTIAGRIRTDAMLAFLPLATHSGFNVSLCTDDRLNYGLAKQLLCASADLPALPGDPDAPCVFSSFGESFQTSPATLGAPVDIAAPATVCPPETDPANDRCSIPR